MKYRWMLDERLELQRLVGRIRRAYAQLNFVSRDRYSQTVDALFELEIVCLKASTLAGELRREMQRAHASIATEGAP